MIIDGTRSIAGSQVVLTPLSLLLSGRLPALQKAIGGNVHPFLWDPLMLTLLKAPVWLAFAAIGLFLMWIARRRAPGVGYMTRS